MYIKKRDILYYLSKKLKVFLNSGNLRPNDTSNVCKNKIPVKGKYF